MSKNKIPQNEQPAGERPRGLREQVKGGWISATDALAQLKTNDPSPSLKMVGWLKRKGA